MVIYPHILTKQCFVRRDRGGLGAAELSIELIIQSVHHQTPAPEGTHIITTGLQQLPFELSEGTWDDARDELAERVVSTLGTYAPGFESSVLGLRTITPLDLERDFGLTGGNIFHGAMTEDQLFSPRPLAGYGRYLSPVSGLYLCGAGAHPGGAVTGAPGHNSARAVLSDLGMRCETASWQDRRRHRGYQHFSRLLERPHLESAIVRLGRQRWFRPVVDRVRSYW